MQSVLERSRVHSRIRHFGGLVASFKKSLLHKPWAPRRRAVGHAHSKVQKRSNWVHLERSSCTSQFSPERRNFFVSMDFVSAPSRSSLFFSFLLCLDSSCSMDKHSAVGGIEGIICRETQLCPSGCQTCNTEFAVVVVWSRAPCGSLVYPLVQRVLVFHIWYCLHSRRIAVVFKMGSVQSISVKRKTLHINKAAHLCDRLSITIRGNLRRVCSRAHCAAFSWFSEVLALLWVTMGLRKERQRHVFPFYVYASFTTANYNVDHEMEYWWLHSSRHPRSFFSQFTLRWGKTTAWEGVQTSYIHTHTYVCIYLYIHVVATH